MLLKYFVIKEEVQKYNASLMIVDPLTKGLPPKVLVGHIENMDIIVINELSCFVLTSLAHYVNVYDFLCFLFMYS